MLLQKRVLKGEPASTARPGSLLADADLDAARVEVERKIGRHASDQELASWLMYPKVFTDFADTVKKYGPVSVLPTKVYFYGMPVGSEISVEIERGKALVILLQTLGETDEEGQVKVFFELNGQQRIIRVPDRSASVRVAQRRKAEDGNEAHVAAPMPGSVSTIAVRSGQAVKAGDVLLTIEAMKMETALHAARDGTVAEVLVTPGAQIDAKDLLLAFAA